MGTTKKKPASKGAKTPSVKTKSAAKTSKAPAATTEKKPIVATVKPPVRQIIANKTTPAAPAAPVARVTPPPAPKKGIIAELVGPETKSENPASPSTTTAPVNTVSTSTTAPKAPLNDTQKQYLEQLLKHMTPIINYLTEYKKKTNCYAETIDKFLAKHSENGLKFTFDRKTNTIKGDYHSQIEHEVEFLPTGVEAKK